MTLDDRQRRALDYFVGMGWTAPQSAGIVANLWLESDLNPDAVGDSGQAYGIAQWHPPRQAGFAAIIGHDIRGSTLEEQLAYVHAELRGTEKAAGDALAACTTADAAGETVSRLYERPADVEGEAKRRGELAQIILDQYDSSPEPTAAPAPQESAPMPIALALLPILGQLIPQIAQIFGKGRSEVAQRNVDAVQAVADTVIKATQAPNLQAAIEKIQTDDTAKEAATHAIADAAPDIMDLMEVGGGGIASARKFAQADPAGPWWRFLVNAAFWIAIIMIPIIYLVVIRVLFGVKPDGTALFSEQLQTVVVTAIVSGLLGSVTGFFFGAAYQHVRAAQSQLAPSDNSG